MNSANRKTKRDTFKPVKSASKTGNSKNGEQDFSFIL